MNASVNGRFWRAGKPVPLGDVQFKVLQARIRMLFGHMPAACLVATSFSCLLAWLLLPTMGGQRVWAWLALKGLVAVLLFCQARLFSHSADPVHPKWYRGFLILLAIDGLVWGSVGWWMTPLARLDLMAVTLSCLLGVASMGTFMLNPDAGSARAFIIPMLVPNAVFYLTRQDSFGLFGGASVLAFVGLLVLETRWGQNRIEELLFLRYTTEEVAQERAKALALAQHHSEAKSRFLATMSHEMRTPLHGMLGLTRMLRDEELRPQAQQRLDLVERSGEHLLSVINDVLDTSKIEAGHVHVERRPFDLSAVVHDVVAISTVNAQAKGLQLLLESTLPASHEVTGDAARVRQVLHNLLGNAVKFTDQGRITVRVSRVAGHDTVTLAVEDSGIGIPSDELPFIFEAFHQVESSMERRHGGAGLGLTISQKLCRAMGGDLRCTSSPGRGSVFVASFGLPVVARAHQVTAVARGEGDAAPPLPPADGRRGLVLLVEDNPINALVADATLQQLGLSVVLAEDGHKALLWLQDHQPDLVLMDCQMPGMDGFETTQHIRALERQQARARVPIVALTANVLPEERQRCLDAGMDDHLPKPFHRHDLAHLLTQHLPRADRLSAMVTDDRAAMQRMA
ncbi:ATP-binding protein [Aquabacterium sp.]|uniref:ATP-binding protein n=1 Tax=Aquabacterium sp. TaxID=1872578 RepID=UPI0019C84264|nr:ATP-binding protein [Aquabacterium sp.]MBC7700492.1 response regulator [Aquabacterium sp.]